MHRGYVRLYRRTLDSVVWRHPNAWRLWCWLLLKATHQPFEAVVGNQSILLEPGQLVTGRKQATKATGLSEQEYRTAIKFLQKAGNVTSKSTNKFSVITIVNWGVYQNVGEASNHQINQQLTSKPPTDNHIQEHKNIKNTEEINCQHVVDRFNHLAVELNLSQVRRLTEKRKQKIRARAKEGFLDNIEDILTEISNSPYLCGLIKNWRITFDWLIANGSNWIKVVEGNYRGKSSKPKQPKVDLTTREREVLSLHGKDVAVEFSRTWQNQSPVEAEAWLKEQESSNGS